MSDINYLTKEPSWISRFLWWCAGADEHFLKLSPMQDRVKYAGIGGIVLCTGLLAAFSGGFAFNTIFGPKGDAIDDQVAHIGIMIGSLIFGIVWGLIIFNLDRFIVSSTGKGDGTDKITWREVGQALPRIVIALILGFAISAPLEIKILESEINSELSKYQKEYTQKLNDATDVVFKQNLAKLEIDKQQYETKLLGYEKELMAFDTKIDQLVANKEDEMRNGKVYGEGPVAKAMQKSIDDKKLEKEKYIKQKSSEVGAWRKQLNFNDDQINKKSDDLRKSYKDNEKKAHGYDGLLKRIQISHEIGGIIPWVILCVFLCIEMGPIFFKMMMNKGVYDYMVENYNFKRQVENGIYKEDHLYEGKNGIIHMEKYRFLEVDLAKDEKLKKIEKQKQINESVIDQWSTKTLKDVKDNPTAYYTEGKDSETNNPA
ncbi:MAG: DUF4407 domain-containing protein [Bacteroidetes bacterium]|nr:DUF4407 domain-containing protein [Bacteroidota bacterium]